MQAVTETGLEFGWKMYSAEQYVYEVRWWVGRGGREGVGGEGGRGGGGWGGLHLMTVETLGAIVDSLKQTRDSFCSRLSLLLKINLREYCLSHTVL